MNNILDKILETKKIEISASKVLLSKSALDDQISQISDERDFLKAIQIKQEVNIAIEEKRTSKEIGSSLEANVFIYADKKEFNLMERLNLEEYFIASKVEKIKNEKEEGLRINVKKSLGLKCTVCWKILDKKCERKHCGIS